MRRGSGWTPTGRGRPILPSLKLLAMNRYELELAEEPVHGLDQLSALRHAAAVRLAADESVSDAQEARTAANLGACDLVTVKLSKVGGFAPLREIASQIPVYLSSALDGPVGIAAAAHAAQALRGWGDAGVAHGLATQRLFAETIAAVECELRDGDAPSARRDRGSESYSTRRLWSDTASEQRRIRFG